MKRALVAMALLATPAVARAQEVEPQPQPQPQAQPQPQPQPQPYPQQQPYPYAQPQPQPQQYGYPPPQRQPDVVVTTPKEKPAHSIKMDAGGAYRKLEDVGFLGMDLRASFGAEGEDLAHYGHIGFVWGATNEHLRTYGAVAGYSMDIKADIVRVGFGLQAGFLWVRRATLDAHLWALGAGAFAHVSADLVDLGRGGKNALYVDARLEGMAYLSDVLMWGPSVAVGFRF